MSAVVRHIKTLSAWSRLTLIALLCVFSMPSMSSDLRLEVFPLKHRPAETLVQQLKPHLAEGGSISASGNSLIIRSTPINLAELHLLLDELDTPLAQLVISVRRGDNVGVSSSGYDSNTVITSGNNSIIIGSDGVKSKSSSGGGLTTRIDKSTVTIRRSSGSSTSGGVAQVRATEGYPAYIHSGLQVPYTTRSAYDRYPEGQYKDVVQGFYVTPRVVGENSVNLEIKVSHDKVKEPHKRNPSIATQAYRGVVTGQLGQWISLGGINLKEQDQTSGVGKSYSTQRSQDLNLYLKVDRAY